MKLSAAPDAEALDGSELVPVVQGGSLKKAVLSDLVAGAASVLVWSGNGDPDVALGANGDFYIDKANWLIFGPKAGGAWPAGVSLIGEGDPGDPGDSAYATAVSLGFEGDEAAWLASLKGNPGDPADNPNYTYAIETLAPGEDATIEATGAYPDILLTLGIPKGDQGNPGEDGDGAATFAALGGDPEDNDALSEALASKADAAATTAALGGKADAAATTAALALKAAAADVTDALAGKADAAATTAALAGKADGAATTAALALKAPLASPALTGTPTAPTAAAATNSTQLATTAYVDSAVGTVGAGFAALAGSTFTGKVTLKASLAGGAYFNIPQGAAVTAPANGDLWTTAAGLFARINGATIQFAGLADPAFTGAPTAPTAAAGTNSVQIATTAYVQGEKLLTTTASRTGYTLAASDVFRRVPATGTITVPRNTTAAIPVDAIIFIHNTTAGPITIAQGTGCTLTLESDGSTGSATLAAHRVAGLLKTDTNAFLAFGAGLS